MQTSIFPLFTPNIDRLTIQGFGTDTRPDQVPGAAETIKYPSTTSPTRSLSEMLAQPSGKDQSSMKTIPHRPQATHVTLHPSLLTILSPIHRFSASLLTPHPSRLYHPFTVPCFSASPFTFHPSLLTPHSSPPCHLFTVFLLFRFTPSPRPMCFSGFWDRFRITLDSVVRLHIWCDASNH
jgi:hypothetical protein